MLGKYVGGKEKKKKYIVKYYIVSKVKQYIKMNKL